MYLAKIKYGLSALAVAATASVLVVSLSKAEISDQAVDWHSTPPTITKNFEYSSAPALTNSDCQQTNLRVYKNVSNPYAEYCTVPTSMGLMDKYAAVVEPQDQTMAYPIRFKAGGNPVTVPVQNQASALVIRGYSAGPGVIMGLFKQLSNHMKLIFSISGMYYDIGGEDQALDFGYNYPSGEAMRFNIGTLSFASNGRYAVIDTIWSGVVRLDLMNLTVQPFAESIMRNDAGTPLSAYTRVSDDGRTALVAYNAPGGWGDKYFRIVDVSSCTNSLPANASTNVPINCRTTELLPHLRQVLPTVNSVGSIRFTNDHTITFVAGYTDASGSARYASYSLSADGWAKTTKQYLALGDSYISGEGALSYRVGTDTSRNQCHQSLVSYPYLLGVDFTSFASVACSGARQQNITLVNEEWIDQLVAGKPTDPEKIFAKENHMPGAILQTDFVKDDNPEAVTISIGGNDIGFGQILEKCVHPLNNRQENNDSGHTCYNTYEDRVEVINTINRQFTKLRSLYENLKASDGGDGGSGRRVYVIGYPQVAKAGGDCGLNVQMNAEEIKFASELITYLNSVIKRAADEAGVQYVDTERAFDGHRLCEAPAGQAAMNGFTITKNLRGSYDFKASFHPNQRGHYLLSESIKSQTSRLTKSMPGPVPKTNEIPLDPNLSILQNVPKTFRPTRYLHIIDNSSDQVIDPSSTVQEVIYSKDYYTKPNVSYDLVINSTPRTLGTFKADANGDINLSAVIPADMPAGFHTLHIYGSDIFGNLIDIQRVVFVTASIDDGDGDGLANTQDSCPLAVQSGVDADKDAIDDVCDPLISAAPSDDPNQEPEGIIWQDNAIMPITIQATAGP